jgi:hypothetical protein
VSKYRVKTHEDVEGTYLVEADSPEEARAHFGDPRIDWESVEQIDYMAFGCEVREVESTHPNTPRAESRADRKKEISDE